MHANAGSVGFPVDNKSMIWREVPWSKGGFKEYPWTLNSMKVHAPVCMTSVALVCEDVSKLKAGSKAGTATPGNG